jgi:hypothetical protein
MRDNRAHGFGRRGRDPGWLYSAVFYRSSESGVPSKPLRCCPVTEFERLAYPALD